MKKQQFETAILEVAKLNRSDGVVVVGSQALFSVVDTLPEIAFLSNEVDVFLKNNHYTSEVMLYVGVHSEFFQKHRYYAHVLEKDVDWPFPKGWWARTISKEIGDDPQKVTCLFMAPDDLCASKLAVGRKKDIEFVADVLKTKTVSLFSMKEKIKLLPEDHFKADAEYALGQAMILSGDLKEKYKSFNQGNSCCIHNLQKAVDVLDMEITMMIKTVDRPDSLKRLVKDCRDYLTGKLVLSPEEYCTRTNKAIDICKRDLLASDHQDQVAELSKIADNLSTGIDQSQCIKESKGISI